MSLMRKKAEPNINRNIIRHRVEKSRVPAANRTFSHLFLTISPLNRCRSSTNSNHSSCHHRLECRFLSFLHHMASTKTTPSPVLYLPQGFSSPKEILLSMGCPFHPMIQAYPKCITPLANLCQYREHLLSTKQGLVKKLMMSTLTMMMKRHLRKSLNSMLLIKKNKSRRATLMNE